MAKRTAIIDIGSNSIRLSIFQRSSHFGFFVIEETKSKIQLAKGIGEDGNIHPLYFQKTIAVLQEFLEISKN